MGVRVTFIYDEPGKRLDVWTEGINGAVGQILDAVGDQPDPTSKPRRFEIELDAQLPES